MNRPFAIYPDSFDGDTLAYWLFGERGGRLDSAIGPAMVNHGAVAGQDGYACTRADGDRLDAAFPGQPNRSACTVEAWVRNFEPDVNWYDMLLYWWKDGANRLRIYLWNYGQIRFDVTIGGVDQNAIWDGGAVLENLLASPDPWHVAGSFDGDNVRLFINGEQKATDAYGAPQTIPLGDWTLRVARDYVPTPEYDGQGIFDEVRLSKVARYTENFIPIRLGEGWRALARGPGFEGVQAGVAA